jgi:hypothetical protein
MFKTAPPLFGSAPNALPEKNDNKRFSRNTMVGKHITLYTNVLIYLYNFAVIARISLIIELAKPCAD